MKNYYDPPAEAIFEGIQQDAITRILTPAEKEAVRLMALRRVVNEAKRNHQPTVTVSTRDLDMALNRAWRGGK